MKSKNWRKGIKSRGSLSISMRGNGRQDRGVIMMGNRFLWGQLYKLPRGGDNEENEGKGPGAKVRSKEVLLRE